MSSSEEAPLDAEQRSAIPKILGLVALGVLAVAFAGALLSSNRAAQWKAAETKGEVAKEELARLESVVDAARGRLAERATLRAQLPDAPESSLRVVQVENLVELFDASPAPSAPEPRQRRPSRDDLDALEVWLEGLYRRVAAGRDAESRLPDLDAELVQLRRLAAAPAPGG